MTLMLPPSAFDHVLDLADQLLARSATLPPPGVDGLSPRRRAAYDRLLDAVNRLPRPLMVLGSLALLGSALLAPDWFAARMDALSDMPEALWWIIGAVLSLHFGARYQDRSQEFRREMATQPPDPELTPLAVPVDALSSAPNPALAAWRATRP